jgi:hypothetical protein
LATARKLRLLLVNNPNDTQSAVGLAEGLLHYCERQVSVFEEIDIDGWLKKGGKIPPSPGNPSAECAHMANADGGKIPPRSGDLVEIDLKQPIQVDGKVPPPAERSPEKRFLGTSFPGPTRKAIQRLVDDTHLPEDKIIAELVTGMLICMTAETANQMLTGTVTTKDLSTALDAIVSGKATAILEAGTAEQRSGPATTNIT